MKDELLEAAKQIIQKYKLADELTGGGFNIFESGNVGYSETFHSFLISDLLDPDGSHRQKTLFLDLFLDELGIKRVKNANVYAEYTIDNNRRIDIVIEDEKNLIAIEMKIYATDSKNQLKDYYEFIKSKNKNAKLYYLTLYGEEASEETNKNIDYKKISFKETIYNWLNECLKEIYNKPKLRDSLVLYKDLIEKLTNKNRKKEKEMADFLNSKEKMKSAKEIVEGYEYSWAKKEFYFWTDLFTKIDDKIGREWSDGDEIFCSSRCPSVWYKDNKKKVELEEDESINKILDYRFKANQCGHIGIAFKKNINDYTVYTILGYYNGSDYSWMGIEIKKDNKCLSFEEIIKLLGNNLGLAEKDDISIYKAFTDLTFASKNNLNGTFELFDEKEYRTLLNNFANRIVELIKEINKINL